MNNTTHQSHTLSADGEHDISIYLWAPDTPPTAVIQLFHGLGEHSARYQRFAEAASKLGYAVCAHDHRGHGPESEAIGFFAPADGWGLLVSDGRRVFEFLQQKYPNLPVVLLGHSMGSYIAQSYAMRFGQDLAALVLSGSNWPSRMQLSVLRLLARFEAWRLGLQHESSMLDKLGFGAFNKPFEPARTELDWLSRDANEVDAYVKDPLCGGPYTTGLWIDLLGGLLAISKDEAVGKVPASLPILITGGGDDPVGGDKGMRALATHYDKTGHDRLTTKIYDGGRHEMLNETNRDEFTRDTLQWIAQQLSLHQA